jgi:hypothetical protein
MKDILTTLRALSAIAVLALTAGCATNTQDKESALIAAGFKSITPSTPAQEAKLKSLPAGKVTMVQKKGITYYVFPDVANNRAFVGTPIEYQAYQQQREAQKLADEQLEAASMYNSQMNFEAWNGWGPGFVGPAYAPGPRMMPPPPPMGGFRR